MEHEAAMTAGAPSTVAQAEPWRAELRAWADRVLQSFAARADVRGVALGGSLARGMEWEHSDIEMAVVVEQSLGEFGYFNIIEGRGVELMQFPVADLTGWIAAADRDPLAVLAWPIQMYQCRIITDPTGLLAQFKERFDRLLFTPAVVQAKLGHELEAFDREVAVAHADLDAGRPLTALAQLRAAFNELILAFYWRHNVLPRSQNRTESRLRATCQQLNRMDFYELFHDVYDLDMPAERARTLLAACRDEMNGIVSAFGPGATDFFYYAVDGEFRWGEEKGILTVHRLYIPWCLRKLQKQEGVFDDPAWRLAHPALCEFTGLDRPDPVAVSELLARTAAARAQLVAD